MRTGSKAAVIIFIALSAIFLYGLIELFQMRFDDGDIYAPYSSLRKDPLGANAYYDALENMPGLSVARNFKNSPKLEGNSSLFLFGAGSGSVKHIDENEVKLLEAFVSKGGRLVVTFFPGLAEKSKKTAAAKVKKGCSEKDCLLSLTERWGFAFGSEDKQNINKMKREAVLSDSSRKLPQRISWHSLITFDRLAKEWEVIYMSADMPVMIERKYGKGTIVLASDSYFTSNEAILKERYPELLAWLVGSHKNIIFDETHLGVYESPPLASLFRKYNLHGMFAGFLLLAVLFIWKNSRSLTPPIRDDERNNVMTPGRDYLSGFTGLLRRNIPQRNILAVSMQEWKKGLRKGSLSRDKTERIDKIAEAFSVKAAKKEEQVKAYKLINKILSEKMAHGKQD